MEQQVYLTPKVEVSFVHLISTEVIDNRDTGKYSITVILDPDDKEHGAFLDTITKLNEWGREEMLKENPSVKDYAYSRFIREHQVKNKGEGEKYIPSGKKTVTFRSQFPPKVYNSHKMETTVEEVSWGAQVIVAFKPNPYVAKASKLIGATLYPQQIIVLEKGGMSTEELFAASEPYLNKEPEPPTEFAKEDDEESVPF